MFSHTLHSIMLRRAALLATLLLVSVAPSAAGAQEAGATRTSVVELRPFVGALVPTGDQRDLLKDALLVGGQLGWQFHRTFAVTGTFGWTPTNDRTTNEEDVDAFQYDVGIEARFHDLTAASRWLFRPYLAAGAGARTYDYRDLDDVDAETSFLGFAAAGIDTGPRSGRLGVRVEARDNVTAFKGLRGERSERKARNDLQFTLGLTIRL
jgi:hypothetical protein